MAAKMINPNPIEVMQLLHEAIGDDGVLRIMPTEFYRQFRLDSVLGFCHHVGLYALPTTELLDVVNGLIMEASPTRHAIEVASGNGALGKGLGIQCTDNFMQSDDRLKEFISGIGQMPVSYGSHVAQYDALDAVNTFKPEVVVAAWMTHKYRPHEHHRGGNMFGIEESDMMPKIKRYILVGNLSVHQHKPLLEVPHRTIQGDFLVSRSFEQDRNAIFVWDTAEIKRLP